MKRITARIFPIAIATCLLGANSPVFAQKQNKLQTLNEAIQQMNLSGRDLTDEELALAIQKNEALLQKYTSHEFLPTVLFQLSELYIRKAKHDFEVAMQDYEEEYQKYLKKEIATEPVLPRVSFAGAIKYLYQILDNHGSVGFIDKVLYRLALCHQEEENSEKSIQFFKRLIAATPHSPFVPEAYFRLGEHYFNQGNSQQAIQDYQQITSSEMWSTPFYDMSLYKLGWANYNLNHYPEAISYFITLLNDIDVLERVKTQKLDRTAGELKRESMTYVAVCFADYSDPELAFETLTKLTAIESYRKDILSQLGGIYLKQDRLDEAIKTFRLMLQAYPLDPEAPENAAKIVDAYAKMWDLVGANEARGYIVKNFNRESLWFKSQKDSTVLHHALQIVKNALYKKGVYHQTQAQEANDNRSEYRKAIDQYRKYLEYYPDDSIAYKINFYLADCYFSLQQYESAAEEYKKVYTIYSPNDYMKEAAYNTVLSYYQASKLYKTVNPQKFTLPGFFDLVGNVTIEVGNPATQQFILACNDILKLIPEDPRIVDVLMKEAEVLNEINRYELARQIYFKVVQDYPHSKEFPLAATLIAQSYFQEEDFEQAEKWYGTVVTVLPDTSELWHKAKIRMASSHYKLAEKLAMKGNLSRAALEYARAAMQYPQSQIAELALVEAGKLLETLGDTSKAALVFENFLTRYPDSRLIEMAALKAASYRERMMDWGKAASDYLTLQYKNVSNRVLAIYKAGISYYNGRMWQQAIEILDEYCQVSSDPNLKLEALCKLGLSYYELDNLEKARSVFHRTIDFYEAQKADSPLNTYFVAQAQFMLGELAYVHFASIDLVPPFKQNLKRKSQALSLALKQYLKAANYKVGEWTTGSTYKIGTLYEEFADAIATAPLPEGLTQEEAVEYELSLKKTARPFQKKALEMYQKNVEIARKNNISNQWVTLSKSHLSILSSVLSPRD